MPSKAEALWDQMLPGAEIQQPNPNLRRNLCREIPFCSHRRCHCAPDPILEIMRVLWNPAAGRRRYNDELSDNEHIDVISGK